jgi:MFS family permease
MAIPEKARRAARYLSFGSQDERRLALVLIVISIGSGLSQSISVLYLTQILGFSAAKFGVVASVAAAFGLVAGPLLGGLADEVGARRMYIGLVSVMGFATVAYVFATATQAAVLMCVLMTAGRGSAAVRGTCIARVVSQERTQYRAKVRAIANIALIIGTGAGAIVLFFESKVAYQIGFVIESSFFAIAVVLLAGLSPTADKGEPSPTKKSGEKSKKFRLRTIALRDQGFLRVSFINSLFMIHATMLTVALPLWVRSHTTAPLWVVPLVVLINTVGGILLQIPATRKIVDLPSAAQASRSGGLWIAASLSFFALSSWGGAIVAIASLIALAVTHLLGEVLNMASSWQLSYDLAPEEHMGQYQGVFSSSLDLSMIVSPLVFGWIVSTGNSIVWFACSVVISMAALVVPKIVDTAQHSRPEKVLLRAS